MAGFVTVLLECKNAELRKEFEEILGSHREFLYKHAKGASSPNVIILELDENNPPNTFSYVRSTLSSDSKTEIFLTARRTDPQVMLEAFRIGVKEFLPQPINRHEVEDALARFLSRYNVGHPWTGRRTGKVISVIGAKGGVGASTVTVNLGMSLPKVDQNHKKSVALVDLDLQDSELPLFLDLEVARGLHDLSEDVSRLDETIVRSVLVKHASGVPLLSSGYDDLLAEKPARGCVQSTLDLMHAMFDYVVVDCGHVLEAATLEALDFSSTILVVTTLNLPAIRRTKRLMKLLREANYREEKLKLVVNRYSSGDETLLRDTEEVLQHKAAWLIPNDYFVTTAALNNGKPLLEIAPRAEITHRYLQVAVAVTEDAPPEKEMKKGSFFSRYFSSAKETKQ